MIQNRKEAKEQIDTLLIEAGAGNGLEEQNTNGSWLATIHPPLGLTYIGTFLRQAGFTVSGIDLHGVDTYFDLKKALRLNPRVIGISFPTEGYKYAKEIIEIVRRESSDSFIVLGGAHASFQIEETLLDMQPDAIIPWEGELVMVDLVKAIKKGDSVDLIAGIKTHTNTYRKGKFIADLDQLPIADRSVFNDYKYAFCDSKRRDRVFLLHAVRGCPMNCKFCVASAKRRHLPLRTRSNSSLISEILWMKKRYNISGFFISDELFVLNQLKVVDFCNQLEMLGKMPWGCEIRVDRITENTLKCMAKSGCRHVQIGIEAGDNNSLKEIGKNTRVEQVLRVAQWCKNLGIRVVGGMVLGLPIDSYESMQQKILFAKKLTDLDVFVGCSFLTPFPGTEYYSKRESFGINIENDDWSEFRFDNCVISTNQFAHRELIEYWNEFNKFLIQRRNINSLLKAIEQLQV
ncbi:B12-binding domain-containing radical SAM protein [Vibrio cholerae]|nr:radical SAM protein [Vibrio cholerae]EGR0627780.1 B12-binding domain-containing radical SAM protein [Vibrio cholerae]EIA4707333.1 B12-binding domain-containing radical SAM protein [Vibrio cholerae]EKF9598597.1 B12-binding domain-containing radical SAM protein [Vibrio cholerae]MBD1196768.1 B12-binding domain-containing radical SAM protein [Vibrio cholerae]